MKFFKRITTLIVSILLVLAFVAGCSGGLVEENTSDMEAIPEESVVESDDGAIGQGSTSPLEPEKIITTLYLNFETTEFEKTNENLDRLIEKYEGYVEHSNISHNTYYNNKSYRYGEFSIRIPRDKITSFKTELNSIGNLTSESTNRQDVTKEYTDTESRLRVVETKEERLLALLEKAEKMEDIIAIENQLSEVIYEKENLKSSLMTLDDKIDFSTVNISLQEVERLSTAENIDTSFATEIANAFRNSLYKFKKISEDLVIALIYGIPYLVIIAIVVTVGVRVFRRYKNDK